MKRRGDARLFDCHHPTLASFHSKDVFFFKVDFFCYIQKIKNGVEGNGCVNVLCVFIFCFSSTCVLLVVTRKTKKQRLTREVNILFQSNENTWNFYTG